MRLYFLRGQWATPAECPASGRRPTGRSMALPMVAFHHFASFHTVRPPRNACQCRQSADCYRVWFPPSDELQRFEDSLFLPCAAFGSKFKDLVDAVDHFWACVDPSDADTRYVWLDIFAIPQNDPGSVLGEGSLLESVIHHSSCQLTLCVLDRALLPLSRLWCLTELSMSSTRPQAAATTATTPLTRSSAFLLHDGGVVFSTYGSTLSDQLDMLAECRIDAAAAVCSDPADTVRLRAALLAQFGDLSHVTAHLKALLAEGLSRQQRAARAALAATGCSEWAVSVGTQTSDPRPSIANPQQQPPVALEHAALMKVASDSLAKLAVPALRNRLRKAALPAAGPRPALVARLLHLEHERTAAEQDAATASCPEDVVVGKAVMVHEHNSDEEWCTPEDEDEVVIATAHRTPAQQLLPLVGGGGGGGIVIRRGTSTGYRPEFVAVLEERW